MLTNSLRLSRLLIVLITIMLLSGCSSSRTWVTSDGRKIIMDKDDVSEMQRCDKEKPLVEGIKLASNCKAFGIFLIKNDDYPSGISYMRKACSSDEYYCVNLAAFIKEGLNNKKIQRESYLNDLDNLYNICMYNNSDTINMTCKYVGEIVEGYYPNELQKAANSYDRLCKLKGHCYKYEDLTGVKIAQESIDSYKRAAEAENYRYQEERRQQRREEDARNRQASEDRRQMNDAVMTGLQSMQNSLNQGAAAMNYANQVNADVDAQLRRQKEERVREAQEQRRQSENAANQQHQAEENRRQQQQVALERSQRDEQDRQQRQRDEQQRVAQLEADKQRQQKKKQLSCTNMTPAVAGTIKHIKTSAGHCDGYIAAFLTNNSGIKVTCNQKFEKNGMLTGLGGRVDIQSGKTVGGESGGLWSCGHSDTDSYKYYCIAADDPSGCMQHF